MTAKLSAKYPAAAKILEEYDNGGALVEIPILKTGRIDLSLTASKSAKEIEITDDDLNTAVKNFGLWPGPVPIGVSPHRPLEESAGPALGVIRGVAKRGKELWAQIFLCNWLYDEFKRGMWAGFSCDLLWGYKSPTVTLKGMSVAGGVFTNRPATDINFDLKAAAESSVESAFPVYLSYQVPSETTASGEEKVMADEKVASLEAQLTEKESQIAALETRNAEMSQKIATLEKGFADIKAESDRVKGEKAGVEGQLSVKAKEASDLAASLERVKGEVEELAGKLKAVETANLATKIRQLRYKALTERDLPNSLFVDMKEGHEVDWLKERFASLEALESVINTFAKRKRPLSTVEKSGSAEADPDAPNVDPDVKAKLSSIGLGTEFVNVTDEKQLKK